MSASEASTNRGHGDKEQDGTFDHQWILEGVVSSKLHVGRQCPDCFGEDEAD